MIPEADLRSWFQERRRAGAVGRDRISTPGGEVFVKWGPAAHIAAEYHGLDLLERQRPGSTPPERLRVTISEDVSVLATTWVPQQPWTRAHWNHLSGLLAAMTLPNSTPFGLDRDNFIGPTPQTNTPTMSWVTFFRESRLEPMMERLGLVANEFPFMRNLQALLPDSPPPSLCHGDLWTGNVIPTQEERCVLIDPAIHAGDIWADVAMLQLFGSPPNSFLDNLAEKTGTPRPTEARLVTYQLYHVLNHAILFGGSYRVQASRMIDTLNEAVNSL